MTDIVEYLKGIALRLFSSGGRPPWTLPPEDPHVGVRQPRWRRRPGGSTAIALAEPDEQLPPTEAVARNRTA
jgi:hypothetical protein